MNLWTELLLRPIFNALVVIYNIVPGHDLGVAILILTLLIRVILYPLNRQSIISQKALQKIQPEIEKLKETHKDNREKLGAAMMEFYKKEKVNPFSSCLPLLIQLPILIAVYQVFIKGLSAESLSLLYSWVHNPDALNTIAFGFLDLTKRSIPLAILAGIAQWWQSKMLMTKKEQVGGMASAMQKQTLYVLPVMTIVIGASLPSGLALYWFFTTVLSALQQLWMIQRKQIARE